MKSKVRQAALTLHPPKEPAVSEPVVLGVNYWPRLYRQFTGRPLPGA